MTQINLLPWREQARQAKKVKFGLSVLAVVLIAFVLVVILHFYLNTLISTQQERNAYLQTQIDAEQIQLGILGKKKKELAVVDKELHFIVSLREKSYQAVRLLDALTRVLPEGLMLNKIEREADNIIILGRAKSNQEITLFLKNIGNSHIFDQPELREISAKENMSGEERSFQLKVKEKE